MRKVGIFLILVALIVGMIGCGGGGNGNSVSNIDPSTLPGIQKGNLPWPPEIANLKARLNDIGLAALTQEGTALHIHVHIDIFINGNQIQVPADIGIDDVAGFLAPIHTHDNSAIIHVESPTMQTFNLGQFFDIWGVLFTKDCIGGYCNQEKQTLNVYVNGKMYSDDPRNIALEEHEEIAVIFGTPEQSPNPIPAEYQFPAEY